MAVQIEFPSDAFATWVPSDSDPWNSARIGHIVRRTFFGANAEKLDALAAKSPGQVVDDLLNYDADHDPLNDLIEKIDGLVLFKQVDTIQKWWFYRMLNTPRPFQERMALFWHNRFATSYAKVENGEMMHNQIELFRRMGLGNYRELLVALGRDPAMLVWLDGRSNKRGKPNENYGRELMELFTLGVGNYGEEDVKQLARCFTGWRLEGSKAIFDKKLFDDGEKKVLGQTGNFDSESAIDVILSHPVAPKFLARKLLKEFVHPNPPETAVNHYAARLVEHKWELKPAMREMLTSRMFFSDWAYRSKIKSPVDIVVGAALSLPGGKPSTQYLNDASARMGEKLLFPPNVKGWDGEETWINANTLLLRFNFGLELATQRRDEFARPTDFESWLKKHNIQSAEDVLDHYARVFLDGALPPDSRAKFLDYLNHGEKGVPKPFVLTQATVNTKVKGLLHLLMSTPEYQLC